MVLVLRAAPLVLLLLLGWPVLAEPPPDLAALREASLGLTNEARQEAGLDRLELDQTLNEAAQGHAQDMLERGYYDHVSPGGQDPLDRYLAAGGSEDHVVAENIARCEHCELSADGDNVRQMHEGWLESPEHRENLLMSGVSLYGFGLAGEARSGKEVQDGDGTIFGVQLFAGAGDAPGPADAAALPEDPLAQSELAAARLNARRKAGERPIEADRRLAEAAAALVPEAGLADFELGAIEPPEDLLSPGSEWSRLQLLGGSCGGCGEATSEADIGFFLDQWRESTAYREALSGAGAQAIGMTVAADGTGTKVSLALVAGD